MTRAPVTQHYEQLLGLEPPWRIQGKRCTNHVAGRRGEPGSAGFQ
jgi:hypothetical protein